MENDASLLNIPFTCKEIKVGIKTLKRGKNGGPDLILNELLKSSSNVMSLVFTKLFNKILDTGKFPYVWNLPLLTPIYKSGDPTDWKLWRHMHFNLPGKTMHINFTEKVKLYFRN
jgi:hypothetical protein